MRNSRDVGVIDISSRNELSNRLLHMHRGMHTLFPSNHTLPRAAVWADWEMGLLSGLSTSVVRRRAEPPKGSCGSSKLLSTQQLGSKSAHLKKCSLFTPAGLAQELFISNQFRICKDAPRRHQLTQL